MTTKHAALAAAIAALLAAPAFAVTTTDCQISSTNLASDCSSTTTLGAGPAVVTNSSGTVVNSGTGVAVTPGVPGSSVTVIPSTSVAVTTTRLVPGSVNIPISSTTVMGGPPAGAIVTTPGPVPAGAQTVVTTYWANVPADAMSRADFRRWEALKP